MKNNKHKYSIENMNATQRLFYENEIKTNKLGSWAMRAITGLVFIFGILIILKRTGTDFAWTGWFVIGVCVTEIILLILVHIIGYNDIRSKGLVITGVVLIGTVTYFLFPLSAIFLYSGPILLSIKYYNPKMTIWVSLFSWVMFLICICANVSLDYLSPEVHALHLDQEMTLWRDINYTVKYYLLPRSAVMLIEALMAWRIANSGKNMVIKQAKISSEAALLSAEMDTAAKIQEASLPETDFVTPDGKMTLSAAVNTAREVGGDFYDYFMINDHLLVAAVADVSDKGLPAAMYGVEAQSYLRFAFFESFQKDMEGKIEHVNLEKAANAVNRQLSLHNMDNMFVTMWMGCIDTRTGVGKYVNAGHNMPFLLHGDGSVEQITNEPQFFMGAFDDANLKTGLLRLRSDDLLLMYTDGVTDARNINDETFGEKRLQDVLTAAMKEKEKIEPLQIKESVINNLRDFIGRADQYDDITLVAVGYNGVNQSQKLKLELETDEMSASRVIDFVNNHISDLDCPEIFRQNLDVIIDEICSNIFDYAYKGAKEKLSVEMHLGQNYISLRFEDHGEPFNPLMSEAPDMTGDLQVGGLGIHLIKEIADDLKYKYEDGKNILTVCKIWNM